MKKLDTVIQNFKYNIKLSGITRVHFVKSEVSSFVECGKILNVVNRIIIITHTAQ